MPEELFLKSVLWLRICSQQGKNQRKNAGMKSWITANSPQKGAQS
jgi:hypothetical protein